MMTMSRQWLPLLATFAVLAAPGISQAGPLVVGEQYTVGNQAGNVFTPNGNDGYYSAVNFTLNFGTATATTVSAYAGEFALDYRRNGSVDPWTPFLSFCLEPDVWLMSFDNPYTAQNLNNVGYNLDAISELWGRFYNQIANPTNGQTNDVNAAAFQVALWELGYDSNPNRLLNDGSFRLNTAGAINTVAQAWLLALNGSGPKASDLVVLVDAAGNDIDRQDLVTRNVPEPATLGLLGLGLLGIGARRRRAAR